MNGRDETSNRMQAAAAATATITVGAGLLSSVNRCDRARPPAQVIDLQASDTYGTRISPIP